MSSQAATSDASDAAEDPFEDLPAFDVVDGELLPRASRPPGAVQD